VTVTFIHVLSHSYFSHEMYELILSAARASLNKWTLLGFIISLPVYVSLYFINRGMGRKPLKIAGKRFLQAAAIVLVVLLMVINIGVFVHRQFQIPKGPNIILISIDTLRADHLGCYGYRRNTSPNIDAFAKESILFENAVVPRPKTTPSVVSYLTGLYPHTHEVRGLNVPVSPRFNSIAEYLKNGGFTTAAFICNWVLKNDRSGLAAGFDRYDEKMSTAHYRHLPFQRVAKDLNDDVYPWLDRNSGAPFFLWLHYMDPHGPYAAPETFEEFSYGKPLFIKKSSVLEYILSSHLGPGKETKTHLDANALIAEYDKEIRYCDFYVGKMLDRLKDLGLYENSLIIITSDHGESLTDHKYYFEHGKYTYDACSKVPLLIKLPGVAGKRVNGQVCLIDIVPTILEVVNRRSVTGMPFEGKSLLPVMEGREEQSHEFVFIEKENQIKAARSNQWKYIEYNQLLKINRKVVRKKGQRELFNLIDDPGETVNLLATGMVDAARQLKRALEKWKNKNDGIKIKGLSKRKMDKEAVEALKSLGYVE
ncbi:MAG: sulfatase, partial [bacterium]|nr:sulfatase [bacterium]